MQIYYKTYKIKMLDNKLKQGYFLKNRLGVNIINIYNVQQQSMAHYLKVICHFVVTDACIQHLSQNRKKQALLAYRAFKYNQAHIKYRFGNSE